MKYLLYQNAKNQKQWNNSLPGNKQETTSFVNAIRSFIKYNPAEIEIIKFSASQFLQGFTLFKALKLKIFDSPHIPKNQALFFINISSGLCWRPASGIRQYCN